MSLFLRIRAPFLLSVLGCLLGACASSPPRNVQQLRPPAQRDYRFEGQAAYAVPVIAASPIRGMGTFPGNLPPVRAESLVLMDARTGNVVAEKNADQPRAVASTQKLLTALVLLDAGNLERRVTIQPEDTRVEPTKLYVKPGESYTRRELLTAMLVKSANDAAHALARDNAGSIDRFAQRMTAKAHQLGATHSRFANPHGLTASGQYSTARDMARIAFHAHHHPFIRRVVSQKYYTLNMPSGPKRLESTNKLLGARMPCCTGMKTGYTRASGRCLITSANLRGRDLILVQLGSETKNIFDDAELLINWGSGSRLAGPSYASYQRP